MDTRYKISKTLKIKKTKMELLKVELTAEERDMAIKSIEFFHKISQERTDEDSMILSHQLKLLINKFKLARLVQVEEKPKPKAAKKEMKSRTIAILLALFLGGLGIHKFYLGENKYGVIYLLFCWTYIPAVFALIEAIQMMAMGEKKFNEKFNK